MRESDPLPRMQRLMNPKFRIWDLHGHLSGVPGLTPEERLGQLLRYADLNLNDCGVRRGTCMVGGKAAAEAGAVTHGAVRCSAWLAVSFVRAKPAASQAQSRTACEEER